MAVGGAAITAIRATAGLLGAWDTGDWRTQVGLHVGDRGKGAGIQLRVEA